MSLPYKNIVNAAVGNPKPRPPKGPNTGLGGITPKPPLPGGLPGAFGRPKPKMSLGVKGNALVATLRRGR